MDPIPFPLNDPMNTSASQHRVCPFLACSPSLPPFSVRHRVIEYERLRASEGAVTSPVSLPLRRRPIARMGHGFRYYCSPRQGLLLVKNIYLVLCPVSILRCLRMYQLFLVFLIQDPPQGVLFLNRPTATFLSAPNFSNRFPFRLAFFWSFFVPQTLLRDKTCEAIRGLGLRRWMCPSIAASSPVSPVPPTS